MDSLRSLADCIVGHDCFDLDAEMTGQIGENVKDKIGKWLSEGETGLSSKTMAYTMLGVKETRPHHPLDPGDLLRCIKFLEAVPEARERIEEMRKVSPDWYRLVGVWDKLESLLKEEMKFNGRSAPKTYAMMKAVLSR